MLRDRRLHRQQRERARPPSTARRVDAIRLGEGNSASQVAPSATEARETALDAEIRVPLFRVGSRQDLPATVTRPGGAPSSEPAFAPYRPPPVEDDDIEGGTDSMGMAPEIMIDLEEELEDLNTDLLTMDCRQSDSPHPLSPRQTAALDGALAGIDENNNDPDFDPVSTVLAEVPSTQPTTL